MISAAPNAAGAACFMFARKQNYDRDDRGKHVRRAQHAVPLRRQTARKRCALEAAAATAAEAAA